MPPPAPAHVESLWGHTETPIAELEEMVTLEKWNAWGEEGS